MIKIRGPHVSELAQVHTRAILGYVKAKKTGPKLTTFDTSINKVFPEWNFEKVLFAKPNELSELAEKWDKFQLKPVENFKIFKTYFGYFSQYSDPKFFRGNQLKNEPYTARYLIDRLEVNVCPYCNRNFIYNAGDTRSSELDHFYPKEKYPFLAISFYNLIPSCKVCNREKLTKKLPINPYSDQAVLGKVKFKTKILNHTFYHNKEGFDLELGLDNGSSKEQLDWDQQKDVLKLDEQYIYHKDIVLELLQKRFMYNDAYLKELSRKFDSPILRNKEDLMRHLLGNYVAEEQMHLRPLSKLTKDIMEELDF